MSNSSCTSSLPPNSDSEGCLDESLSSKRGDEPLNYQCPCCDYFTFPYSGTFDCCPVCFWEDDGQGLDQIDEVSGPNDITLRQGRENFISCGACDPRSVSSVCKVEERSKYVYIPRETPPPKEGNAE